MSADNGGPAFPTREKIGETFDDYTGKWHDEFGNFGGLTIRDYFAAKAMREVRWIQGDQTQNSACAAMTYEIADAMLKARES